MEAGLAVIAVDETPAARIVRASCSGEVWRAGDVDDLAGAIERLARPERLAAAARAGERAVLARRCWAATGAILARSVALVARGSTRDAQIGVA